MAIKTIKIQGKKLRYTWAKKITKGEFLKAYSNTFKDVVGAWLELQVKLSE